MCIVQIRHKFLSYDFCLMRVRSTLYLMTCLYGHLAELFSLLIDNFMLSRVDGKGEIFLFRSIEIFFLLH